IGLIAFDKKLKLNLKFQSMPNYNIEIYASSEMEPTEEDLVFRNFEDGDKKILLNGFTLSGNTLTANSGYFNQYGIDYYITIKNYSDVGVRASLTSASQIVDENAPDDAEIIPATITPQKVGASAYNSETQTADYTQFRVHTFSFYKQKTTFTITLKDYNTDCKVEHYNNFNFSSFNFIGANTIAYNTEYTAQVSFDNMLNYQEIPLQISNDGGISYLTQGTDFTFQYNSDLSKYILRIPAENVIGDLSINFNMVYTITYLGLEDADNSGNPTTFTANASTFKLAIPTMLGKWFLGWTWEGQEIPEGQTEAQPVRELTIDPSETTANLTYTANWRDADYILKSGKEFNKQLKVFSNETATDETYADNYISHIFFGEYQAYSNLFDWENGIAIDKNNKGDIRLFHLENKTRIYILTGGGELYANPDSSYMFYCLYGLKGLQLGKLNTKLVTDMSFMFARNQVSIVFGKFVTGLDVLDLSSFDTSNVKTMYGMFADCETMKSVNVSSFNTCQVEDMSYMFSCCSALTNLDVANFDTKNVIDMSAMFDSCKSLTSLDLSNFDTEGVQDMHWMFYSCENLSKIYVSERFVTNQITETGKVQTSSANLSKNMFSKCVILVGGNGTVYNSSYTDKTYARIDGGTSSPGYFTAK
ncbi:MAG: BspA family leucine-rich repeat surface protein, partial [Clostridia bacterium]|nr:BspA family leucine-rich repeat surface protein [Clostridia bacterium]